MQCNCQVVNNSDKVITLASVGHSASEVYPDSLVHVLTVNNLPLGAASQNAEAPQESFTLDWWTMVITFEGDDNQYILCNGFAPFKECETPANGAASLHVLGSGSGAEVRIDTFENQNYTDSDGSCSGTLYTAAEILEKDNEYEEIIETILEILG
ncbi:hypothetical protein [Roseivirga pacifica]|uniref:hypothetical protein n=1 Tax=Roseivirga pacifica TaxID=1267423 RepID=UPI003BACE662